MALSAEVQFEYYSQLERHRDGLMTYAEKLEQWVNETTEALREFNNSTAASMASPVESTLAIKTDRIMRGQIQGMHGNVRTSTGTQSEAAQDREP